MSESSKKAKSSRSLTHILVVDVEATGGNVLEHWMPEFAAALWKIGDKAPTSTFYRCMDKPPGTDWCPATMVQFWKNPEKGKDGVPPIVALEERQRANGQCDHVQAMKDFVAWARDLETSLEPHEKVVVVFDTSGFDAQWMSVYLGRAHLPGIEYLFGGFRPVRDINSFYFGIGRKLKLWGSEDTALEALGIAKLPDWIDAYAHDHHPLNDANQIAATASYILSCCNTIQAALDDEEEE